MQTNIGNSIGCPLELESKDILFRLRRLEERNNETYNIIEKLICDLSEVKRIIGLDAKE